MSGCVPVFSRIEEVGVEVIGNVFGTGQGDCSGAVGVDVDCGAVGRRGFGASVESPQYLAEEKPRVGIGGSLPHERARHVECAVEIACVVEAFYMVDCYGHALHRLMTVMTSIVMTPTSVMMSGDFMRSMSLPEALNAGAGKILDETYSAA